jgi:hypothetical protein
MAKRFGSRGIAAACRFSRWPFGALTPIAVGLVAGVLFSAGVRARDSNIMTKSELLAELDQLKANPSKLTLLIIPPGVEFRYAVDAGELVDVACAYDVDKNGPTYRAVIDLLAASIIEVDMPPLGFEARTGIVFEDQQKHYYFSHELSDVDYVEGYSYPLEASKRILMAKTMPAKLRKLVVNKDVVVVKTHYFSDECKPEYMSTTHVP